MMLFTGAATAGQSGQHGQPGQTCTLSVAFHFASIGNLLATLQENSRCHVSVLGCWLLC
jgi:hypothetical protein